VLNRPARRLQVLGLDSYPISSAYLSCRVATTQNQVKGSRMRFAYATASIDAFWLIAPRRTNALDAISMREHTDSMIVILGGRRWV
jgi:hypothetical protein